ncbi:MAG TPA: sigma-54 dependent transcriptional regulator [Balneolales bacterium]|nr:sigma-54 dependent transcriptional regulator [Balneolales bacterium]
MKETIGRILIVDDDEDILQSARLFLKQHGAQVDTEKNPSSIANLIKNESYDVILLDMNFNKDISNGEDGFFWMRKILEIDPSAVVIFITAYGDVGQAVRAIKEGATDFVLKPWQNEKLLATISSALKLRASRNEADNLRSRQKQLSADMDQGFQEIIGRSPAMQNVFDTINKVAATDANVLILGENGTGKELVARALHRRSKRADEVFISVDMGALTETLFESELFGHVKGAFTDAHADRPGRFEIASEGTLFLDEIGNLSIPMQSKLLTILQQRQVTRVGSNKTHPIDIRLICATNQNIHQMVQEQDFRQDLLYRINTIEINLPPLRDRRGDIPLLLNHFLEKYAQRYNKNIHSIGEPALNKLTNYGWPGNVRELIHSVERAVIMTEHDILQPEDFFFSSNADTQSGESLVTDDLNLDEIEKIAIRRALKKHYGNISHAADELGITRAALYRRMEKYGL